MCGQNSNSHLNLVVKPGCLLFFAVGFSFFLQFGTQSHGSKPYVTRKASFYAGIEQELHSTIEWCGQFRTCLCWYLLLRDSRRGHSRPNVQSSLHLPSINSSLYPYILIHAWMHAPTLCIGVPAFHYVMGGGWELCTQSVIVKRIRGDRTRWGQLMTLPYLTLPYLTLPYLTLN